MELKVIRVWRDYYSYNPNDYVLKIPIIPYKGIHHLFAVLHELGHAYYKHTRSFADHLSKVLRQEQEAWEYARTCVKPKYYKEFDFHAKMTLKTWTYEISNKEFYNMVY